ncbi:ATP-dependent DNA helicase RecG [Prochlorococcus marinus]|uniref:ATP-dependent DNA helicase RecG n=1 Tax=Prochlorococcus marinus TaxID=1219 RepID=UPI0022B36DF7|nr:ATP-dependent DNA helicase RecG [Prochlorococcus marinus]
MVEEYSGRPHEIEEGNLNENVKELKDWINLIQKALTIEAENGFKNIQGRNEHFHTFISREIESFDSPLLKRDIKKKLILFAQSFIAYPSSEISKRRRLVIDTRKCLYSLGRQHQNVITPFKPPNLRLSNANENIKQPYNKTDDQVTLDTPILKLKGIGEKYAKCFENLGIIEVRDLLLYYPRDYVDYSSLKRIAFLESGETATIVATIRRANSYTSPRNKNLSVLELHLEDITGRIKVTRFFIGRRFSNRYFLKKQETSFAKGTIVAVSGLVKSNGYGKTLNDPLIEILESQYSLVKSKSIGRLLPIYSLTDGLTPDRFRSFVQLVLPVTSVWPEPLNDESRQLLSLLKKGDAIREIHRPSNKDSLKEAKRRLVFDEFLFLQLGLIKRRLELQNCKAPILSLKKGCSDLASKFFTLLPFELTKSQYQVLNQIEADIAMEQPMSRLLQGDVGSGKTVVAIAALLIAIDSGWQGALMAPTEVLAQQHYLNLCKWLPQLHVTVELLTGSTSASDRKRIYTDLETGNLKILVGTHALIESAVSFQRLGLVVVDEQHRFGVNQRNLLLNKGLHPHLLTMTATPIPRTLALSLYGDLDVSQINELPPGRTPVKTILISNNERDQAYQIIRDQVANGLQAYFVLPLVEDSEKLRLRSAIDTYHELSTDIFPQYKVGLLHGRMPSVEKKSTIQRFAEKQIEILVSTTVIEVGVDVADATVMVIDHADRFGLAQLHQLRGRVGRGTNASQCVLIDGISTTTSRSRLEVLVNSNNGFDISEIDLRLRGPGQVLGTKQSGLPDFALANLVDDETILESARNEASRILKNDPELNHHVLLKKMLKDHWKRLMFMTQLN